MHRLAVEDDRWQVQLHWDRTKFFLILNTTIVGAGAAFFRLGAERLGYLLVGLLLAAGALTAFLGASLTRHGKRYHRAAVANALLAASKAGLLDPPADPGDAAFVMPSGLTPAKANRILANIPAYVSGKVAYKSMTGRIVLLMYTLGVAEVMAAAGSAWVAITQF